MHSLLSGGGSEGGRQRHSVKTVHLWQSDPDFLPTGKGCGSLVFLLGRFPVPGVASECSSGSLMECGFLPCREWAFLASIVPRCIQTFTGHDRLFP